MTLKKRNTIFLLGAALAVFAVVRADDDINPYRLLTTISITGGLVGFDISWVDSATGRYYLADRGTATTPPTPRIDVIDTERNKLVDQIGLSTAANGVVAIHRTGDDGDEDGRGTLVVGGADSTAIFIDLAHPHAMPVSVSTHGSGRADELAYDPKDHLILIANDRAADLFVTFIKTTTNPPTVVGKVYYNGSVAGNPVSTGGIEQPVWDPANGKFYLAIPATTEHANGEVDEIDPVSMKITHRFPTTCAAGPAGLALIPGQHLMTSCGDVVTISSGAVVNIPNVGADEIWFNPGDERVYFGGYKGINVPVVSALSPYKQVDNLVVGLIATPPAPNHTTHSVAADSENNRVFVPVSHEGVKVYARGESDN